MKRKNLVIDDDQKLNELLSEYLSKFGYDVKTEINPFDGLRAIKSEKPDLIILDVMLPDMEGFEVCKMIRKEHTIPVIMLTARGDVTDRIVGLELGADDYVPKPFEPRELVARIQTVLRRSEGSINVNTKTIGSLRIDYNKHLVELSGKPVDLTTAEYQILTFFVRNSGKVLERDQILENMRGLEWDAFNRSVDVLISRLRQKLQDDPKNPEYIKTIWGAGYMFIGDDTDEN
ncbi:MAG: response regulator transcription factor [Calditrichaceae bacterium]